MHTLLRTRPQFETPLLPLGAPKLAFFDEAIKMDYYTASFIRISFIDNLSSSSLTNQQRTEVMFVGNLFVKPTHLSATLDNEPNSGIYETLREYLKGELTDPFFIPKGTAQQFAYAVDTAPFKSTRKKSFYEKFTAQIQAQSSFDFEGLAQRIAKETAPKKEEILCHLLDYAAQENYQYFAQMVAQRVFQSTYAERKEVLHKVILFGAQTQLFQQLVAEKILTTHAVKDLISYYHNSTAVNNPIFKTALEKVELEFNTPTETVSSIALATSTPKLKKI